MIHLTPAQCQDAREWLMDCFPTETDEIADASAARIERAVQRHFEGGIEAFLATYQEARAQ
jgi:hypothetical protein